MPPRVGQWLCYLSYFIRELQVIWLPQECLLTPHMDLFVQSGRSEPGREVMRVGGFIISVYNFEGEHHANI